MLLQLLLIQVNTDYQWTLCAPIQDPSDSSSADEAPTKTSNNNCFCSTLPIRTISLTGWPYGVTEQTNSGQSIVVCNYEGMVGYL